MYVRYEEKVHAERYFYLPFLIFARSLLGGGKDNYEPLQYAPGGVSTEKKNNYYISAKRRVRVYDTDFAGVVYYGSYTRWIEEAVAEYMRSSSLPFSELQKREIYFVVREVKIEYLSPVRYDEEIELGVRPGVLQGRRITFQFCFFRGDKPVARGEVTYSSTDKDFRPAEIPPWLKEEFMKLRR